MGHCAVHQHRLGFRGIRWVVPVNYKIVSAEGYKAFCRNLKARLVKAALLKMNAYYLNNVRLPLFLNGTPVLVTASTS